MTDKTINWGLIGAGRIAHSFAQDLPHAPHCRLRAVAARDGSAARSFGDKYGITTAYEGYDSLLADPAIDAVYISTPHTHHARHAEAALRAGKAVLCEKPLTATPPEARHLRRVAQETGGYLMEGMWTFFLPAVLQARAWISDGRIGELIHLKADFGYPIPYDPDRREWDHHLAGGCLLEMGVYPVALAASCFGGKPSALQVSRQRAENGVESDVVAVLNYGDRTATIATSFRAKLQNWAYLIGTEGYIAIPNFWRADRCSLFVLDDEVERFDDSRKTHGFDFEAAAVADDLRKGRLESTRVPLVFSEGVQQLMARIREA